MPRILGFALLLPALELLAFIAVAAAIGFGKAVLLQLAISLIGVAMLGSVLTEAKASMKRGEGVFSLALDGGLGARGLAGLLFAVPGFITDALGLVALAPTLRARLSRFLTGKRTDERDAIRPQSDAGQRRTTRDAAPEMLDLDAREWREVEPAATPKG